MSERKDITLTSKEAAKYLGIGYSKVLSLAATGEIPHVKFASCQTYFFRKDVIDSWLEIKQSNPGNDEKVSTLLKEEYPWIKIK